LEKKLEQVIDTRKNKERKDIFDKPLVLRVLELFLLRENKGTDGA